MTDADLYQCASSVPHRCQRIRSCDDERDVAAGWLLTRFGCWCPDHAAQAQRHATETRAPRAPDWRRETAAVEARLCAEGERLVLQTVPGNRWFDGEGRG